MAARAGGRFRSAPGGQAGGQTDPLPSIDRHCGFGDKSGVVGVDQDLGTVIIPVRRGELLDRKYLIGEPLGSGGMGVVVAAENVQLGQKVAIKFLSDRLRSDGKALVRFLRQARPVTPR